MLTQFVAAFDDVVIGRFNKDREEKDRIEVRYVYAPKQRVLHDIINENKTLTLPVISVNVNSVVRDETRVFNKIDGFYYQGTVGSETVSRHLKSPIPVNINLSVSIISRYQTDMDQIISNFVPFCNPYVIISWKVPEDFNLSVDQEIRSEVLWNGDVGLSYPTELNGSQKARVTADTSFTIKGWLFKDTDDPVGNIYFIDQNFHAENLLETYDNYEALTGREYSYPLSASFENEVESFELSGSPFVTDIFYNGVLLQDNLTVSRSPTGSVILNGYSLGKTSNVLVSSNNLFVGSQPLTSVTNFSRQDSISGRNIPFTIINDNTITFNTPTLSTQFAFASGIELNSGDNSTLLLASETNIKSGMQVKLSGFGTRTDGGGDSENPDVQSYTVTSVRNNGREINIFYDGGLSTSYSLTGGERCVVTSDGINESYLRFIPFNRVGYDFSDLSYMDTLCGRGLSSTFIILE